jgi:hypothetical protein
VPRYGGPGACAGAEAGDCVCADEARSDSTLHANLQSRVTPNATTRAVWGESRAAQRPRTITLIAWHPVVRGALHGFATVELPIGLKLVDCPVLVSNGKVWVSLPSKPVLDRDGRHKTDGNGKPAYVPVLEWLCRDLADRFSAAVVELVRRAHPGDLEGAS